MKKQILSSFLSIVLALTPLNGTTFAAMHETENIQETQNLETEEKESNSISLDVADTEEESETQDIRTQEEINYSQIEDEKDKEDNEESLAQESISEKNISEDTQTKEKEILSQSQTDSLPIETTLIQEEDITEESEGKTFLTQEEFETMELEEDIESDTDSFYLSASKDDIANGVVDESYGHIIWSIDRNGKLMVKGTGNYTNLHEWHSTPWYNYHDDILSAEICVTGMTNAAYMFEDCSNLTEINMSQFDTSSITHMGALFNGCSSLEQVDLSNFKTENVLYMTKMFSGCSSLKSLDLGNFNTTNVTDMSYMFSHCKSLTNLFLNNFDTSQVTNMSGMFYYCEQLIKLEINNFNTASVTNMAEMFGECKCIETLDLSHFYTDKIESMRYMFANCSSLINLDLSGINAEKVTDYNDIFLQCSNLSVLYTPYNVKQAVSLPTSSIGWVQPDGTIINGWIQPDGTIITELPQNLELSILITKNDRLPTVDAHLKAIKQKKTYRCKEDLNLDDIIVRYYDIYGNVTIITDYTTNIDDIDMSAVGIKELIIYYDELQTIIEITVERMADIASGTVNEAYGNISWVIDHEGKLTVTGTGNCMEEKHFAPWEAYRDKIITAEIDITNMTNASCLFWNCTNLTSIVANRWDTSKITTMSGIFEGCSSLEKLDLSSWNTGSVTDMTRIFYGCSNLKELNLSNWNTANVTTMYSMFGECKSLTSLNIKEFQTGNVTNMMFLFHGCSSLESLDISHFDTKNVTDMSCMFQNCNSLTSLNLDNFNTENVTNMMYMFNGCNRLTQLDLRHFNTQNVTSMRVMFCNCSSLTELNVNSFQTEKVTDMSYMFSGCQNLFSLDLSSFSLGSLENTEDMFSDCAKVSCIHTPKYCTKDILLPISESTDKWYMEDGTICTKLPIGLAKSVILYKNRDFAITCTVTYDLQGHGQNLLVTVNQGEKLIPPEAPMVEGYDFEGWYKDADCIYVWDFDVESVTADMILYAKWVVNYDNIEDFDDSSYTEQERIDLKTLNGTISSIKKKNYDGNPYEPIVKVTIIENGRKKTLTEGTDYRILYTNNVNAGKNARVTVRGNGIYKGELTANFEITPKSIKKLKITANTMTVGYQSKPSVYVYDGTKLLAEDRDFTLQYSDDLTTQKTNSAKIIINGTNNYTGSATLKLAVYEGSADKIICSENVTLKYEKTTYTGKAIKNNEPIVIIDNVRLTKNKHYKVQYQNNVNAGTAFVIVIGKGAYKGKVVKPFTITAADTTVTIKPISAKTYNGKLQKPSVTVKSGNKKLKKNKDYTITYKNNLHKGTATVIIKGKGNYEGVQEQADFSIQPQKITKVSVKGTKTKGLTLTYAKKVLKEEIDYTVEYAAEQKNKVQVTITGKGDFTGTIIKKIKIQ